MGNRVRARTAKDMQILKHIVEFVTVDVVDVFAWFCPGDSTVLQIPMTPVGSLTLSIERVSRRFMGSLDGRASRWRIETKTAPIALGDIAAPKLRSRRHTAPFLVVCVQGIAVLAPHLIMAHTHLPGRDWTIAKLTSTANNTTTPTVFWGPVTLDAFVVHKAMTVGRVLAITTLYCT